MIIYPISNKFFECSELVLQRPEIRYSYLLIGDSPSEVVRRPDVSDAQVRTGLATAVLRVELVHELIQHGDRFFDVR